MGGSLTMLTLVFSYYEAPVMLSRQIEVWNTYSASSVSKVILVDDGSQVHPAADVVRLHPCSLPLELYRVKDNIPWNISGARNLGCSVATGWIYLSDIGELVQPADVVKMGEGLTSGCFYQFPRAAWPSGRERRPAMVNLVLERELFDRVGGFDEDYSGAYGNEDMDFYLRMKRTGRLVYRADVRVWSMPSYMVPDACASGLSRDNSRNNAILLGKVKAGFPAVTSRLRFQWERVA